MNERFKKQSNEYKDRIYRRDANNRDSAPRTTTTTITSPSTSNYANPSNTTAQQQKQQQPQNPKQSNNTSSGGGGYLQPTPKNTKPVAPSAYLEPVSISKQPLKPPTNQQQTGDGYLTPTQKPEIDTYGGPATDSTESSRPMSDTYTAPPRASNTRFRPPPTVGYINEQGEPDEASGSRYQNEMSGDGDEGYLQPSRQGQGQASQRSSSTVNSTTSSTAPLKRFAPLATHLAKQGQIQNSSREATGYVPPELPKLSKLSMPRNHTETDV